MGKTEYDVVIWGAAGFTGKWVAKHFYDLYQGSELKWAMAGRNPDKLKEIASFIGDTDHEVPTIIADSQDEAALLNMAKQTKVILSTVGPYAYYGSLLVKVCAESGTHYCDLTGEVPWMRRMISEYHEAAQQSGARIVFSCGFDSISSDMGVYFLQAQAKAAFNEPLSQIQYYLMAAKGGASGGTVHSLLNVIEESKKSQEVADILENPYALNPNYLTFEGPDVQDQTDAIYDDVIEKWTAPFVMAAINTRIVRRSNALMDFSYGKGFSYAETQVTGSGIKGSLAAKSMASGAKLFFALASKKTPLALLKKYVLPAQGKGPRVDPNDPGFYKIKLIGTTSSGEQLTAIVHGDADPGYGSTSKMLSEAAICLADYEDALEVGGGCWTPSSAMGAALLKRLRANAGLSFDIE